jgi:phospholipid/cholesterol/gamma-HCH transport system substrate-binding protein
VRRRDELIVGFTVVIALIGVLVGALWLSETTINQVPTYRTARFRTVGGLSAGNPVVVRGVRVGRVSEIRLGEDDWVEAVLEINSIYVDQFPEDGAVIAASASLFGEWQAEIIPRTAPPSDPNVRADLDAAYIAGDDVWPGATLPDIGQLTAQAGRIASDIATVSDRVQTAFDSTAVIQMQSSIRNFAQVTDRINQFAIDQTNAMDSVGASVVAGVDVLSEAATTLGAMVARIDSATSQGEVDTIVQNAAALTGVLRDAVISLQEVVTVIHENQASIQRILQGADSVATRMQAGRGTVGRLVSDSLLYVETTRAVQELRLLVEDIKNNPRKYFKFSVF